MSTATSDRARPNSGGASRDSPFNNEMLAAAMRTGSEIPNLSATLLSPRIRASISDEPDIKRELDSPTPKRPRISVSSQDLLDQLSVVHEGARRLVNNTGSLVSLDHPSSPSRAGVSQPPPTRSPLARRGPLRTVILNQGGTNPRWISGGNERGNTVHNEGGSFGGYQSHTNERGSQRPVHTRRSPHNSHHHNHHSHRDHFHTVRRSPNQYNNYHNQHYNVNRRNTRQRERERERNRAAALAAARAVAANLQDSFSDILGEEVIKIFIF